MSQRTIGQLLSISREAARASLYQAAQDTKIRMDFLEAMERDDFQFVSGGPYVRGMLRSYVRWLNLPEERVLAEFDRLYGSQSKTPLAELINQPADVGPKYRKPQWLVAAVSAAGLLLVFSLIGLMNPSREDAPPEDPLAVEPERQTQAEPGTGPADQEAAGSSPGTVAGATQTPIDGLNVTITVEGERAWMEAHVDGSGSAAFTGTKTSGEELVLSGDESVRVTIGNLGAVRVRVNGRDLGPPGPPGAVATFTFTPESTDFVGG